MCGSPGNCHIQGGVRTCPREVTGMKVASRRGMLGRPLPPPWPSPGVWGSRGQRGFGAGPPGSGGVCAVPGASPDTQRALQGGGRGGDKEVPLWALTRHPEAVPQLLSLLQTCHWAATEILTLSPSPPLTSPKQFPVPTPWSGLAGGSQGSPLAKLHSASRPHLSSTASTQTGEGGPHSPPLGWHIPLSGHVTAPHIRNQVLEHTPSPALLPGSSLLGHSVSSFS